jgi:hypothetical protein
MKHRIMLKRIVWLFAVSFVSALALSACKSTEEHPSGKSEHPTQEHPTQEHPQTNAPARNP